MLHKAFSSVVGELKSSGKKIANGLGIDVRNRKFYHVDPFRDQLTLLQGLQVATIVDGGANVGDISARYRLLFPNANIYAFEPGELPAQHFSERFAADSAVKLLKVGLSDEIGHATFNVGEASVLSSLLPSAPGAERYMGAEAHRSHPEQIPTVTLDHFAAEHGLNRIDILKLDIQGAEGKALRGADSLLRSNSIRLVYSEVLFGSLYDGQAYFHDLSKSLHECGYQLYGLYNLVQGTDGTLSYGDAIFMNRELASSLPPRAR